MQQQQHKSQTTADWIALIAERAGVSAAEAEAVLGRHAIEAQPTLPRQRSLCIRSIVLEGVKHGTTSAGGPFRFEWPDLGPGLWALMSDMNSRGKSSILNIIQCALRGDYPARLKSDIWKWLSRIDVCFEIDAVRFRSLVEKPSGEEHQEVVVARLSRHQAGSWIDLYEGPPCPALEAQTAAVFMEELGFAKFHAFSAKTERGHSHGWPAMASALFISDPGRAIFGDILSDALPLRLLQLFTGLPWISTYTAVLTAIKDVETASRHRSAGAERASERLRMRLSSVEQDLVAARSKLAACPDRDALRRDLAEHDAMLVNLQTDLRNARARLEDLRMQTANATAACVEAKRTLQQVGDEQAAGYVFRRLRPVCCPACEAGIEPGRYQATEAGRCALCGNPELAEADEEAARIETLKHDVADAEATVKRFSAEVDAAEKHVRSVENRRDVTEAAIEVVKRQLAPTQAAALEIEIVGLHARAAELREVLAEQQPESASVDSPDIAVLKAAEYVTKRMFEDRQRDILKDVSMAITRLAQRFGVENVAEMEMKPHGVLSIRQGGSETSFTKLSPGERLRVRVAAALAVVEVARARGYGRHPGLLVLDSPGAHEMTESDFAALLTSVHETVSEAEGIQVIMGAVARPELVRVVPREQRIHVQGDAYLF
jgi:predicted  nucleic acid-binding Zn-ribbon protein